MTKGAYLPFRAFVPAEAALTSDESAFYCR